MIFSFEKLDVWQESRALVKDIYAIIRKFPSEERYALSDQIKRAVISIPSNIAEGSGRSSCKEKIHFFEFSYASLMEVLSQLDVAMDLGYITEEEFNNFEVLSDKECRLLSGLTRYFQKLSNP